MKKPLIAPSILSADFLYLKREIESIKTADLIHIDVMDGHFVPNITFGPTVLKKICKITDLPLDVHLMIENPDNYIKNFVDINADYITVHYEACKHLNRTIQHIKSYSTEKKEIKAGVSINPATSVELLEDILPYIDMVLIMSVNPGFGGQKFIENSVKKVKKLKKMINDINPKCLIEIDGGISDKNVKELFSAGVDIFVAGSYIFNAENREEQILSLRNI